MSSSNFIIPSSPPESPPRSPAAPLPPATPDTRPHHAPAFPALGGMPSLPSTTPAGHPPAPVPFALAGAPAESFLSRATASSGSKPFGFAAQSQSSPGRRVLPANPSAPTPLGRSIRGARQPSTLSRQLSAEGDDSDDDDDDDEARGRGDGDGDDDASGEDEPPRPGDLFRRSSRLGTQAQGIDAAMDQLLQSEVDRMLQSSDGESGSEDTSHNESDDAEMFLSMRHDDRPYGQPVIGDESNLMFMTPAATDRVRKEAEDIYRRSTRFGASVHRPQFSSIARDFYTQNEPARLTEAPALVLATEDLVCRLYDEGVGAEDDAEKMDNSLANIACRLVELWDNYAEVLPPPEGEDFVTIGPGSQAEPFANAAYVANLMLRMHHTRFDAESQAEKYTPLPEVLLDWLRASHNMYPDLVREVSRHKPSPACHAHYWQVLRSALLRGDVESALQLLKSAGWEHARQGPLGDAAYTGAALDSTRQFVGYTCDMLEKCPGIKDDWDIWNSSWTMFRMEAKASLDRLAIFTEGRQVQPGGFAPPAAQSLSAMSRQASSKIPWSVYENLQVVYGIVLGEERSILDTAQDWCEATVGLFAWGDDGQRRKARVSLGASALRLSGVGDYFERLAAAFHQVLGSDMGPNILSPVEVAVACAFEGDVNAVIGCLRVWSLPVATSVAEIASLGKWLPLTPTTEPLPTDTLTMDDLNMLGVQPPSIDDVEGIKDTTMVLYARELAGVEHMSERRDGWEIAIQVLGRMDQPQKSEETVGELLRDLLKTLDEDSSQTVDKMWRILNDLGMVTFAEETAEVSMPARNRGAPRAKRGGARAETNAARRRRLPTSCRKNVAGMARHCGTTPCRTGRAGCARCSTSSCRTRWRCRRRIRSKRTSTATSGTCFGTAARRWRGGRSRTLKRRSCSGACSAATRRSASFTSSGTRPGPRRRPARRWR